MDDLWGFAKKFLTLLPGPVFEDKMPACPELTGPWEGGPAHRKLDLPRSRADVEVLQNFLGLLEEESQMQEVLKSSVEDYVDESYCSPRIKLPTRLSYFN